MISEIDYNDKHELASIYSQLGYINDLQNDYNSALAQYQNSLGLQHTCLPLDCLLLAETYSRIGAMLHKNRNFSAARSEYQRALDASLQAPKPNQQVILNTRNIINHLLRQEKIANITKNLYVACEVGDLMRIRFLLPLLNPDVVHTLLEYGVLQRISNKAKKLAADVATDPVVQQLLDHSTTDSKNRFFGEDSELEWSMDEHGTAVTDFMLYMKDWGIERTVQETRSIEKLKNVSGMNTVWRLLQKALDTNDGTYILRAYTTSSNFCKELNKTLAQLEDLPIEQENMYTTEDGTTIIISCNPNVGVAFHIGRVIETAPNWAMYFIGTIYGFCGLFKTPKSILESQAPFTPFFFTGRTYRGMSATERDLAKYKLDRLISLKNLTSTSKNRAVATLFAMNSAERLAIVCIYNILIDRTALDIHTISEFPEEEEVLILPGLPFIVTKITRDNPIEIELRQEALN